MFLTTRKQNKMVNCRFKMRGKDAVSSRRHEFYCFLAFWLATYSSQQNSHWLKGWQLKLYLSELLLMLKIGQRACENLDNYCKNVLAVLPIFPGGTFIAELKCSHLVTGDLFWTEWRVYPVVPVSFPGMEALARETLINKRQISINCMTNELRDFECFLDNAPFINIKEI